MLIRGLGPRDGVESRACWRKGKACGEDEVYMPVSHVPTQEGEQTRIMRTTHFTYTSGSLSVGGTTVPPLSVYTGGEII